MEDILDDNELPGLDVMNVGESVDRGGRALRSCLREGELC